MPLPDLAAQLARVRALTQGYMAGRNPESFLAFRDLVQLILGSTILPPHGAVRLSKGKGLRPNVFVLGGYSGPIDPLPLNDGRFLRLTMTMFLSDTKDGARVKIENSSIQYQLDKAGDQGIFRYDYIREPPEAHPSAHLHIRGHLTEDCLTDKETLEDLHFPTNRVSLESIVRLLIEQFHLPSNTELSYWRPLLAESETGFLRIAHRSLSGPAL